jgi:hypothetical protein
MAVGRWRWLMRFWLQSAESFTKFLAREGDIEKRRIAGRILRDCHYLYQYRRKKTLWIIDLLLVQPKQNKWILPR